MWLRIPPYPSCLSLPRAGITDGSHHNQLVSCFFDVCVSEGETQGLVYGRQAVYHRVTPSPLVTAESLVKVFMHVLSNSFKHHIILWGFIPR